MVLAFGIVFILVGILLWIPFSFRIYLEKKPQRPWRIFSTFSPKKPSSKTKASQKPNPKSKAFFQKFTSKKPTSLPNGALRFLLQWPLWAKLLPSLFRIQQKTLKLILPHAESLDLAYGSTNPMDIVYLQSALVGSSPLNPFQHIHFQSHWGEEFLSLKAIFRFKFTGYKLLWFSFSSLFTLPWRTIFSSLWDSLFEKRYIRKHPQWSRLYQSIKSK